MYQLIKFSSLLMINFPLLLGCSEETQSSNQVHVIVKPGHIRKLRSDNAFGSVKNPPKIEMPIVPPFVRILRKEYKKTNYGETIEMSMLMLTEDALEFSPNINSSTHQGDAKFSEDFEDPEIEIMYDEHDSGHFLDYADYHDLQNQNNTSHFQQTVNLPNNSIQNFNLANNEPEVTHFPVSEIEYTDYPMTTEIEPTHSPVYGDEVLANQNQSFYFTTNTDEVDSTQLPVEQIETDSAEVIITNINMPVTSVGAIDLSMNKSDVNLQEVVQDVFSVDDHETRTPDDENEDKSSGSEIETPDSNNDNENKFLTIQVKPDHILVNTEISDNTNKTSTTNENHAVSFPATTGDNNRDKEQSLINSATSRTPKLLFELGNMSNSTETMDNPETIVKPIDGVQNIPAVYVQSSPEIDTPEIKIGMKLPIPVDNVKNKGKNNNRSKISTHSIETSKVDRGCGSGSGLFQTLIYMTREKAKLISSTFTQLASVLLQYPPRDQNRNRGYFNIKGQHQ